MSKTKQTKSRRCAVRAGSAKHRCARIRPGLYNYRAYNIRRFSKGWAVLNEDGKAYHPPQRRLCDVCRIVDTYFRILDENPKLSRPNVASEPRASDSK